MLLSSPRNTLIFALGCLAVTIALMDDLAPNRLVANADEVADRRLADAATSAGQTQGTSLAHDGGPWAADPVHATANAQDGTPALARAVEAVPAPVPVASPARSAAAPAAPIDVPVGRAPVAGVRERSAPLGRSYADDGSRNLAEDLRAALG